MSDMGDRGAAPDPAKGPGGTGKGKTARDRLKDDAQVAFDATIEDAEHDARGKLKARLEAIESKAAEIRRWTAERGEVARDVVEDHPLAVTASAFGVGLLIGLLAARI
jgi:ElaB/YqjD/DUF883 family membrane-anchored ribosome-binding protein